MPSHSEPATPGSPTRSRGVQPVLSRLVMTGIVAFLGAVGPHAASIDTTRVVYRGPFVPFGMCMSDMKVADQIALCERIGYTGLGLSGMNAGEIKTFSKHPDVVSGRFRIHSTLWWITVNDTIDTLWMDGILDDARKMGMAIWMVADGNDKSDTSRAKAVKLLHKAADRCQRKGVQLVLYPHLGCVFETADEAVAMRDSLVRLGHPEVKTSIHLCHELKAGHRDTLTKIVKRVAPFLALASVSGADTDTYGKGGDYWGTAIMPLDRGTYDPRPFLKALSDAGYAGPMELHTYNLKNPGDTGYDQHLERSWVRWQQMVQPPVAVARQVGSDGIRCLRALSGVVRIDLADAVEVEGIGAKGDRVPFQRVEGTRWSGVVPWRVGVVRYRTSAGWVSRPVAIP